MIFIREKTEKLLEDAKEGKLDLPKWLEVLAEAKRQDKEDHFNALQDFELAVRYNKHIIEKKEAEIAVLEETIADLKAEVESWVNSYY